MAAPASVGVAVKAFYIGLFCVMVGAFAELLLVRGYTSCFNLGARWAIQVAAEYSIYGVVIGSWAAYKESSRTKGVLLMVSMFFLGSLPSMGYIIMQFYKLSPEEYSKDPLYFVLARRHMREVGRHIKGPSIVTARAIFSALAFYMMGVLMYTIIVEIFNPPNINKCMVSNVIDIYVHFAAISVWVAYKESTWTSAFLWILSILCFRGLTVCVFMVRQLFYLSPQQHVSLVIFNSSNRDLQSNDPLLTEHPII